MAKTKPFDDNFLRYEDWFEKNRYAYESELAAISTVLPQKGEGVEIGVGTGRFAGPLGIRWGIDPSREMRRIAASKGIFVLNGTAENIPFPDNSFDFALIVTTVCFLDNVPKAFREIFRIVKTRGSVIVGFVDKESSLGRVYLEHKNNNVFYREAKFITTIEITGCLNGAGFRKFSFYQTIFKDPGKIREIEPVLKGYGLGSFIVIKGVK
ncbi:MAG: class I SAM-dependent methyltransferase [Spirochaetales bacterium]|nr:class I SAM-dependent methyltransferase [Spirochaetales bacterium]